MNEYVFTFGDGHLNGFKVKPNEVALVIEADNLREARELVFNYDGIGSRFCTSYKYSDVIEEFTEKYGMKEYTLEQLESLRVKKN